MRREYGSIPSLGLTVTLGLTTLAFAGLHSSASAQQTPPPPSAAVPAPPPTAATPVEPQPPTAVAPGPITEPGPVPEPEPAGTPEVPPPPLAAPPPLPAAMSPIPDGAAPAAPVPPQFPPAIPSLDYGVRFRIGSRFQNPDATKKMDRISTTIDNDIYFSGQLHRYIKWQAGVTAAITGAPGSSSSVNITALDIIAKFEPLPEFSVWFGRMIVMADRWVPSGPWGMDEFLYPGLYIGPGGTNNYVLPKGGPGSRDVGTVIWGSLWGGHFKYFAGAYEIQDPSTPPLWSGRLQLNLLDPEPAFYHRTTYYGEKDILAIGVGGQLQREGSVGPVPMAMGMATGPAPKDTHTEFNADLIFEKRLGDSGTLSVNASVITLGGDYRAFKSNVLGGVGYLFPNAIGIGKLRPSIRFQQAQYNAPGAAASQAIDFQLGYEIVEWWARIAAGYRYSSFDQGKGKVKGNMIFIGVTIADP